MGSLISPTTVECQIDVGLRLTVVWDYSLLIIEWLCLVFFWFLEKFQNLRLFDILRTRLFSLVCNNWCETACLELAWNGMVTWSTMAWSVKECSFFALLGFIYVHTHLCMNFQPNTSRSYFLTTVCRNAIQCDGNFWPYTTMSANRKTALYFYCFAILWLVEIVADGQNFPLDCHSWRFSRRSWLDLLGLLYESKSCIS